MISLAAATLVLLAALPLFFGISAAGRDPVFASLDSLSVPAWAATKAEDNSSGSRWCFIECRFRERTAQSEQPFAKTAQAYEAALAEAGWQQWKVGQCPEQPVDGVYNCWRRDEFTLDLWVRQPACAADAVAAQGQEILPSANPDGSVDTPKPGTCTGSTITIKVQNAITDQRGQPEPEPKLGETPDAVPGEDPLPGATPTPS
jgi:integrin beta 3